MERDDEERKDSCVEWSSDPAEELEQIAKWCASRPVLDSRNPDAILGYDERGLPS
jgi:hypothetical protein